MKYIIIVLSLSLMVGGIGCMALSELITPADINNQAVEYAVNSGVANEEDYQGYPNLYKANRLVGAVDAAHDTIQLDLQQQAEKDDLDYSINRDVSTSNYKTAVKREEQLFGERGLLSLGASLLGVGGLGGILGLMRRKPGDISPEEMQTTLADATGKTTEELSTKQRQMIQLVKGIQEFMNTYKSINPVVVDAMKDTFDKTQDSETQAAVAVIKKTV